MAVKDYIDTNDFTKEELLDMIELARSMKTMIKDGGATRSSSRTAPSA